ncbi:MAG: hypothetical protein Q7U75_17075, partial [Desulfobacterales bacterium]|nr:hypothetical protein [Desulfobacterales bacterium]
MIMPSPPGRVRAKKKSVTAFRAGNGFFIFGVLCLRHYQPLFLIAANEADDKNEYKDDNVDNGDQFVHKIHVGVELPFTLTGRRSN